LLALTTRTTSNITGTSLSTPTTVARAVPDSKPTHPLVEPVGQRGIEEHLDQNGDGQQADDQGLLQNGFALEGEQQDQGQQERTDRPGANLAHRGIECFLPFLQ
jgi:hypothetical protein